MKDSNQKPGFSADLIGYHLGLCDEEDRRRVEAAFADAQSLASARQNVERILSRLDADDSPIAPKNLVASIMDRVEKSQNPIPFPKNAAAALQAPVESGGRGPMFALRELVGLAAAILLFVGIFVPGYRTARNEAQRAMCANNMRLIGNGYANYAEMFGSPVPYVRSVPAGATWLPANGSRRFTNTQNNYVLVANRLVPARVFVCPSRPQDVPLETDSPESLSDFPDVNNVSFSTMPVTGTWQQQHFDPQMPLVADMNPLVDDAQELQANRPVPENSNSHGVGRGQNVLRGNMSVIWATTPRLGIDNDDIYRLIGVKTYTGQEWPHLRSDAFLIP